MVTSLMYVFDGENNSLNLRARSTIIISFSTHLRILSNGNSSITTVDLEGHLLGIQFKDLVTHLVSMMYKFVPFLTFDNSIIKNDIVH